MTKRLILIRHAKSSWAEPGMLDHDRPLNHRGRSSAIAIGNWLRETGYEPDRILCSTATRTRETCALLAFDAEVEYLPALYHAGPEMMLPQLQAASGDCVAMIGHNPGIGELASLLVQSPPPHGRFVDYPTGATMVADFAVDDWAQAKVGTAKLVNFITPRELTGD